MAEAVQVDIAEGVRDMIAATTLSEKPGTVERNYADWDHELSGEDAERLRIDVVGHTTKSQVDLETRGHLEFDVFTDIAIRQKFGQVQQNDDTGRLHVKEIDRLMLVTQEVYELMMPNRITDLTAAVWQDTKILAAPVHKHLRDWRQFTSMIRIEWRYAKEL